MTAAAPGGIYIALRNSPALRDEVALFIDNIRAGLPQDQNPLLVRIMERFLDEAVDTLIVGGSDAMQLHGMSRRMVDMTVSTIKATCHMLSRRVLRNMKNDDVRALAEHMDDLRLARAGAGGEARSWTVIPLPPALYAEMLRLDALICAGAPQPHLGAIQDMLFALIDVVVEHVYVRTLATLRLGPIARKLVEMGYATAHGGARKLIAGVLPRLSDEQVRLAASFCLELVIRVEGDSVVRARSGIPETCESGAPA
jgi:hypothetical protein